MASELILLLGAAQAAGQRPKRDGLILANKYSSMMESGAFSARGEVTRFLGVSRARATQVLNRLNREGKN